MGCLYVGLYDQQYVPVFFPKDTVGTGGVMDIFLRRLLTLRIRRKRRFRVRKGLSVVLGSAVSAGKIQVYDISMGGLSFFYTDLGYKIKKRSQNVTVIPDGSPTVVRVACRTVGDAETGKFIFPSQHVKRHCLKFERLSARQKKQVRQLIREYALKR